MNKINNLPTFPNYQTLGKLGGGSFGQVYLVQHQVLGYKRAIKRMKLTPKVDLDMVMTEVNLMINLSHDNIIKAYDCVKQDNNTMDIVMEYAD